MSADLKPKKAKKKPVATLPLQASATPTAAQLADWLESRDDLKFMKDVRLALEYRMILEFLRSPRHRSNAFRRCCESKRGKDVPHAKGCTAKEVS